LVHSGSLTAAVTHVAPVCAFPRVSARADALCVCLALSFSRLRACGGFGVPHVPRIFFFLPRVSDSSAWGGRPPLLA